MRYRQVSSNLSPAFLKTTEYFRTYFPHALSTVYSLKISCLNIVYNDILRLKSKPNGLVYLCFSGQFNE